LAGQKRSTRNFDMTNSKGRAARKTQRERVKKAAERGLPTAELAPLPARLRPQLRDASGAVQVAAYSKGSPGEVRRKEERAKASQGGLPMLAKVGIGAALALALVLAASQLRKSTSQVDEEQGAQGSTEKGRLAVEPKAGSEEPSLVEAEPDQAAPQAGVDADLVEDDAEPTMDKPPALNSETERPAIGTKKKVAPAKIAPSTVAPVPEVMLSGSVDSAKVASPSRSASTSPTAPTSKAAVSAEMKPAASRAPVAPSSP
jgi:hypothetical protein